MSEQELSKFAADYEAATNVFLTAVNKIQSSDLDKPKQDGRNDNSRL
jgi:hypothetical protein